MRHELPAGEPTELTLARRVVCASASPIEIVSHHTEFVFALLMAKTPALT